MSLGMYVLDEAGNPVPCEDTLEWGRWMERGKDGRRVARTAVSGAEVSTVFLGLDHSFGGGAPVLFETMVFGGALDGEQDRYHTRAEAEAGHEAMCERVRNAAATPTGASEEKGIPQT